MPIAFELKHRKTAQLEAAAGRTLPEGQGIVYARQELVDNPANPGGEVGPWALHAPCLSGIGRRVVGSGGALVPLLRSARPSVPLSAGQTGSRPPGCFVRSAAQALWALAKHIFRSADSGFHQLISHWLVRAGRAGWSTGRVDASRCACMFNSLFPHGALYLSAAAGAKQMCSAGTGVGKTESRKLCLRARKQMWGHMCNGLPAGLEVPPPFVPEFSLGGKHGGLVGVRVALVGVPNQANQPLCCHPLCSAATPAWSRLALPCTASSAPCTRSTS